MIRKTLLAIVAAGTLAFGMSAATQTASANHIGLHFGFGFGSGHHGHHMHGHHFQPGHYGSHCHNGTVKKWNKKRHRWIYVKVRNCHNHWHRLGHH